MNKDTGFGFTILFNKKISYKTVLKKRNKLIEEFYVDIDGERHFSAIRYIHQGVEEMNDVSISYHKNPEDGTEFKVYHFIINASLHEREEAAKQARA